MGALEHPCNIQGLQSDWGVLVKGYTEGILRDSGR